MDFSWVHVRGMPAVAQLHGGMGTGSRATSSKLTFKWAGLEYISIEEHSFIVLLDWAFLFYWIAHSYVLFSPNIIRIVIH